MAQAVPDNRNLVRWCVAAAIASEVLGWALKVSGVSLHFVVPWLVESWIRNTELTAFLVSLAFPALGAMTFVRLVTERKFYFGEYVAFWLGTGLAHAILMGIAAHLLNGTTPQSFYTEPWFYLVVYGPIYAALVYGSRIVAKQNEAKKRPLSISKLWSERYYTYVGMPLTMCLTFQLIPIAIDHYERFTLVFGVVVLASMTAWAYAFWRDGTKPVPLNYEQWSKFITFSVVFIYLGFGLAFGL